VSSRKETSASGSFFVARGGGVAVEAVELLLLDAVELVVLLALEVEVLPAGLTVEVLEVAALAAELTVDAAPVTCFCTVVPTEATCDLTPLSSLSTWRLSS
jgi:hypothetical protein